MRKVFFLDMSSFWSFRRSFSNENSKNEALGRNDGLGDRPFGMHDRKRRHRNKFPKHRAALGIRPDVLKKSLFLRHNFTIFANEFSKSEVRFISAEKRKPKKENYLQ